MPATSCIVIYHPNGTSELYLDDHDNMLHADGAYLDMFHALKATGEDARELDAAFADALGRLETNGYVMHYLVFPGSDEELTDEEEIDGELYRYLDGEPYRVDGKIDTNIPIM